MKRATLIALTVGVMTSFAAATPAMAQGRYCLQGRIWGYPGNGQFASYGQCMASASGTNAYCGISPRYAYARRGRGYER
ncbi:MULTISPECIES: DUF3551 domain-containing protein [unclassified Bradyrhizobium]|uniref:DUF3551 domain-containing protein n=1 Tax=unclassified Bradyrhizobium TaxID=2631580 RepID=UPI0020B288DA|nr:MULTISPECIES: DUF3551 domain-containing protein [unclassified Bradyrhizobium]MCP3401896.1 DUF3551 domain-containing protein [Bradyrhizobium sp. CCGB20]MCP3410381.1 DUF3551 domain-containing protein [Bradyrhizobium sp. CCGB01]